MSNLFSVEEFMMVDNAIKWEYNDLYPLDTQYDKYAGGKVWYKGKSYTNLYNVYRVWGDRGNFIYYFDEGRIESSMEIDMFFDMHVHPDLKKIFKKKFIKKM